MVASPDVLLLRDVAIFFLSIFFFGHAKKLRIYEATKNSRGKRRPHLWAALGGAFESE